jgi:alpha-methylacyl-CoA racemase
VIRHHGRLFVAVGGIEPQFREELRTNWAGPVRAQAPGPRALAGVRNRLAAIFRTRTRDEWAQLPEATGACVSPVLSLAKLRSHPHNPRRENLVTRDGVVQPEVPPRFSRTPGGIQKDGEPGERRRGRWLAERGPAAS